MSRKQMRISTGLYAFCALVWTVNFFLSWHQDGMIEVSTGLYGVAALCFGISAVLGLIRLKRLPREEQPSAKTNY